MTILCVSDHRDPRVYSSQIRDRFSEVDLILGAGDLELTYYGFIVSSLNKPLLFVFGNHNLSEIGEYKRQFRDSSDPIGYSLSKPSYGSTFVSGKVKRVSGIIVAGLGGSRRYNGGPNQFSEFQMLLSIIKIVPRLMINRIKRGRYLDILLTHAPPFDTGDKPDPCHRGFKVFRWFIRRFRPAYLIHGHIHLYDMNASRESIYYGTKIVNAYNHVTIELTLPIAEFDSGEEADHAVSASEIAID